MAKLVPGTSIVLHTVFYILVLRSGALYPVNITVSPSYNFSEDDPWVFQEDQDCRSHTSVQRPRMFPREQLPAVPALQQPAIQPVDLAAVQEVHESTGRYLQRVRGQPQPPVTSASVTQLTSTSPTPGSSLSSVDLSSLLSTDRTCPVCQVTFSEFNKLKRHITIKHSRESPFMCKKCKKNLGSASSLDTHMENYHQYRNFVCNICQFTCQFKKDIAKHMRSHPDWVVNPSLRCSFCLNKFHNKDGLTQHTKICKHNPNRQIGKWMCRTPGCGSMFTLKKKRNYHEVHICSTLKKNIGRGRGSKQ